MRESRPIQIETTERTHPTEYAVVGKKRGKLVWFCGDRRRQEFNKPVWSTGDGGWAQVVSRPRTIKQILKNATEHPESANVKQISIVKLITNSSQTAEIITPQDL